MKQNLILIGTGVIFTLVILISGIFVILNNNSNNQEILSSTTRSRINPTPTPIRVPRGNNTIISYGTRQLQILSVEIPASASMILIPNFTEKQFGEILVATNSCDMAINGGFYTGAGKPLGLFTTKTNQFGKAVISNVANGFFWENNFGERFMDRQPPEASIQPTFIFQTGPYMPVINKRLSLINDGQSRRSLLGITNENKFYAISVLGQENNLSGPYLADIPVIFALPEIQKVLPLVTVLNLDGGSASFFYSKDEFGELALSSLSPIGSLLCVKL
jgi:hypothetical protein